MTKLETEFLKGLAELTQKTGITINGCGCCSSPYIMQEEIGLCKDGAYQLSKSGRIEWVLPQVAIESC